MRVTQQLASPRSIIIVILNYLFHHFLPSGSALQDAEKYEVFQSQELQSACLNSLKIIVLSLLIAQVIAVQICLLLTIKVEPG